MDLINVLSLSAIIGAVGGFIYHYIKAKDPKKALEADISSIHEVLAVLSEAQAALQKVNDNAENLKKKLDEVGPKAPKDGA